MRAADVTGVQSCALPISGVRVVEARTRWPEPLIDQEPVVFGPSIDQLRPALVGSRSSARSEERRVGKEWRSTGSADQYEGEDEEGLRGGVVGYSTAAQFD